MTGRKLGALPRDHSKPAPVLESYLTDTRSFGAGSPLPLAPHGHVDRESKVASWPMYLNNRIGCCTVAGIFHAISAVLAFAGTAQGDVTFSDSEVVKVYSAVSGYDPATGANDNGATLADVCRYMTDTGAVDVSGRRHKLVAWAEVGDPTNLKLLKRVLNAFGTVYLAIDCPQSALDQNQAGQPWRPVPGSPIVGGHAIDLQYSGVTAGEWDDETVITWGKEQKMNEAFAREQIVEAVAVVPDSAVDPSTGLNVAGLDMSQLVTDCQSKYLA